LMTGLSRFGVSSRSFAPVYAIEESSHHNAQAIPEHMLWALMFLKIYAVDSVLPSIAGGDSNLVEIPPNGNAMTKHALA